MMHPIERARRFWRTPKGGLTVVFAFLLTVMGSATGPNVIPHVLAAVFGACATELAAMRFGDGRIRFPSSALLSGLIVAFVLGPETSWPITTTVAALATASKYGLASSRGHWFNPAALALLLSVPLFSTGQSWWGAGGDLPWPFLLVVLAGGAFIVDRIDRFPLVLTFGGVYFGLLALLAFATPTAVAELFRAPFVQSAVFLAFFMLTDPPTSPGRYRDQVWFGALCAVSACGAQLLGLGESYLLVGLLVANGALSVQRWLRSMRVASRAGINSRQRALSA